MTRCFSRFFWFAGFFAASQSTTLLGKAAAKPPKPQSTSKPATSPDQAKAGKGVIALFAEAQRLFNAGKFNEALVAYDRIIKRYPSHEPSTIQYAKTLYRLDRIPESYNLFARINPQYLDPETSYEYGYASYVNQRWDAALFAFKRVPGENALYDLANYYGALSAIKLKKYAEAEDMLDKAVVLPDKLSKSRVLYQKHVQSLKHLQEKADLEQAAAAEKARLNAQKNSTATSPQGPPGAPVKTEPKAYEHKGFLFVERLANVKVTKEHQTIDKHGFSQTTYDNDVGTFRFAQGPLIQLPLKKFGDNASAVGLQIDLQFADRNSKGRQERIVVYEDSRDIPRVIGDDFPSTHSTVGTAGAKGWAEFALPYGWWSGLTASLSFEYPEFERGKRTGKRSATPHVGRQFSVLQHKGSVLGQFTYEQLTDAETEPLVDTMSTELVGEVIFVTDTTLTATLSSSQFNYHLPTIMGPDDTYAATFRGAQQFPLGIILSTKATVASQQNNLVRNLPTFDVASADGTTYSGQGRIEATPIPWFTIAAQYDMSKTDWIVHQPEREDAYKKNVADYVDQTTFSASLNFKF